jgi:hypothetical protein
MQQLLLHPQLCVLFLLEPLLQVVTNSSRYNQSLSCTYNVSDLHPITRVITTDCSLQTQTDVQQQQLLSGCAHLLGSGPVSSSAGQGCCPSCSLFMVRWKKAGRCSRGVQGNVQHWLNQLRTATRHVRPKLLFHMSTPRCLRQLPDCDAGTLIAALLHHAMHTTAHGAFEQAC